MAHVLRSCLIARKQLNIMKSFVSSTVSVIATLFFQLNMFSFKRSNKKIKSEINNNSSPKKIAKRREQNKIRPIASSKFLNNPMRNSNVPDVLGQFIDPMGARATYTQGIDPTNTGA
ncbi:hypothetical protein BDC45DRAFT_564641 [Circinella umbellata]|nr:hypothetical protein BDC45DRAFT_564641 [Circinella umbellata]